MNCLAPGDGITQTTPRHRHDRASDLGWSGHHSGAMAAPHHEEVPNSSDLSRHGSMAPA